MQLQLTYDPPEDRLLLTLGLADSLYALIRLLDDTLAAANWGLDLWRPSPDLAAPAVGEAAKTLH